VYADDAVRIQDKCVAYHARLRQAGPVVPNGPVRARPVASRRDVLSDRLVAQSRHAGPTGRPGRMAHRRDHDVVVPAWHDAPAWPRPVATAKSGISAGIIALTVC
jgi:hypothetical protein